MITKKLVEAFDTILTTMKESEAGNNDVILRISNDENLYYKLLEFKIAIDSFVTEIERERQELTSNPVAWRDSKNS